MSELQNDGSRAIRDVVLEVQFLDAQDDLIQTMRIEVDTVKAHSSLAEDDLGYHCPWIHGLGRIHIENFRSIYDVR